MLGQAEPAVANVHVHAFIARCCERNLRAAGELRDPFNRVNLSRELREHGCLVARAGADIEHALIAFERKPLADEGNDERLRNRLSVCKRQRRVLVGEAAQVIGYKELAGHAGHRREHALVMDPAVPELIVDPEAAHAPPIGGT